MARTLRLALLLPLLPLLWLEASGPRPHREPPPTADPARVRLEVSRDTWVSSFPAERHANLGGEDRLKLKGIQELTLLDVDPAPLRGRVITAAELRLRSVSADPLRRVTVSTLAAEWEEGTSRGYRRQEGSASFLQAREGRADWAWPGSDLTAVFGGSGHTLWRFADATPPNEGGWQRVAVDPRVVALRVAGVSHGFVLQDDVGSEYLRQGEGFTELPFRNRFVASREAGPDRAPYLLVRLGAADREPPGPVEGLTTVDVPLPPGRARLRWRTPRDRGASGVVGFLVRFARTPPGGGAFDWERATPVPRYLIPLATAPGEEVELDLRDLAGGGDLPPGTAITIGVSAVDGAGNAGPPAVLPLTLSARPAAAPLGPPPAEPFPAGEAADGAPAIAGVRVAVIDPLDKVQPVSGRLVPPHPGGYLLGNHLWSAARRLVRLSGARNETVAFQVLLEGAAPPGGLEVALRFEPGAAAPRPALFHLREVLTDLGPLPDPLLPLVGGRALPAPGTPLPGRRWTSLLAEVYLPHGAAPGVHRGRLTLTAGGRTLEIGVELRVWAFTLPDVLSFVPQMNAYRLPAPGLAYYRLAHLHRTCFNRLPYDWRGRVDKDYLPRETAAGWDWSGFDRRFGPLLDGSAFADLPRRGVPVEAFYLPLNESWPAPIDEGFRGGYWAEEALTAAYRERFMDGAHRLVEHLREKEWSETLFELYLNNKLTYKTRRGGWSGSSAPWSFDEPVNTQDFWALRWYGVAFQRAVDAVRGPVRTAFRCDVSRPQWQRDLLDGVVDEEVVGGAAARYARLVAERKRRTGALVLTYGSPDPPEASNVQPAAWCLDAWSRGLDGVVAWQTLGRERSWRRGDKLALFYPGTPAGLAGPVPSVRLAAFRRGQQDVEYLTILTAATGEPRWAVEAAVRRRLGLDTGEPSAPFADQNGGRGARGEGAGTPVYPGIDPVDLWRLRTAIGAELDRLRPPDRRRWADLAPPPRDPAHPPGLDGWGPVPLVPVAGP